MTGNVLEPGTHRLGWLADGDATTPEVSVLLEDARGELTLTIPWGLRESPYRYWFSFDMHYGDDPERTLRNYSVPEILWFGDVRGTVALVGCQARRASIMSPGEGVAHVAIAVLGAEPGVDYRSIHGLRSELPGLSDWMNLRSLTEEIKGDGEGRLQSLSLHVEAPEPIRLQRALNLHIRPSFSFQLASKADTSTIHETLLIETRTKDKREWRSHFEAHNAVRDLLNIAAWRNFGYAGQWCVRDDDPITALSGDLLGEKWSPIRTYLSPTHEPDQPAPRFLFNYADVGPAGLRRWTALRLRFARGLAPIGLILDEPTTPGLLALAQLGIGLDGLGYQLALDAGLSRRKSREESHRDRLLRVIGDLTVQLPFNAEEWATRSAEVYNGVKHANRDMPERRLMGQILGQNRLVFRLWVASRVGVPREVQQQNMWADPAGRAN